MPTLHPQASFEPIPPDLDLYSVVESTPNFEWVLRISAAQIRRIGPHEFERLVRIHVIQGGKPLVIDKWNDKLWRDLFSAEWLEQHYDKKQENVRDLVHQSDIPMTTGHYLRSMKQLTNQWNTSNYRDDRRQRLYMKDIDCPPEWRERLERIIPRNLFYLNDNVDKSFGEQDSDDPEDENTVNRLAPAGDLMSSLPEEMRAENLMCYIGHEGTYTPAHREMCASLGQNIMVEASGHEDGEREGSSVWFMTETKDREVVSEYFLSMLGHDIEIEKHFAQINAWKKAHFPVYVVEQRVGDFILVPPLAPHQVWNRGTRTVKVAWNRTTVESLELALSEALPKARLVCRDEQYKNKAIIFFTLRKYYQQMVAMDATAEMSWLGIGPDLIRNSVRMKQMAQDFRALFSMFTSIMADEMFATKEAKVDNLGFDSNITCSYCRCNIFNRFLTCTHCIRDLPSGEQDTYDVCMECYAMGRSCACVSGLSWCEQWDWAELMKEYEDFRAMIIKNDGFVDLEYSPMPLEIARKRTGKKSVAQICQEQLRRRPFKDIMKHEQQPDPEQTSEPEVQIDDQGRVKKKKSRKRKSGDVYRCHVCSHKDYRYRLAFCTNPGCEQAFCFGVLYRAFDSLPQSVLQDEHWTCPKCRGICNCGKCRATGITNPYQPKMTLLGHDTRTVADDRSVESLVDFRLHNLQWLKALGDEARNQHSRRMEKLKEVANAEKAREDVVESVELPDGEIAQALENAIQEPGINGYEAQNGVSHDDQHLINSHAANGLPSSDGQPGPAADADMSLGADESVAGPAPSYPPPPPAPLVPERMLGMGYYNQDESEDRIIFDPYQAPSAEEDVVADEPISEAVLKQIKLAKRRAKAQDDGDTDFIGPKGPPRKKRKDKQAAVEVENMDPALLAASGDAGTTIADAGEGNAEIAPTADPAEQPKPATEGPSAAEDKVTDGETPYVPTLRHARPKVSYVEEDEGPGDLDEIMPANSKGIESRKAKPKEVSQAQKGDPLDVASALVRAWAASSDIAKPTETEQVVEADFRPKGRPGRPRKSDPGPAAAQKRRGRPPRASMPASAHDAPAELKDTAVQAAEAENALEPLVRDAIEVEGDGTNGDVDVDEIEAQLRRELRADEAADDSDKTSLQPKAEPGDPAPRTAPKRRGRPPKVRMTESSTPSARRSALPTASFRVEIPSLPAMSSITANAGTTFTSMAERMAMRGKKFKIGQRNGQRASTPRNAVRSSDGPDVALGSDAMEIDKAALFTEALNGLIPQKKPTASAADDDNLPDAAPSPRPQSSAPGPPFARQSAGPTVVRLDSDSDEDDALQTGSDDSSSDDDEDILNDTKPVVGYAKRGRPVGFRGRGRGRGQ
jgi:hypothetical protein